MDEIERLLHEVKATVHGWMDVSVYRKLYETAAGSRGGTIVEIGTSSGAATIALALGARASGHPHRLISADLFQPGLRPFGATLEEKRAGLFANFERFGVADAIRHVHGNVDDLIAAHEPYDITILLIDADGRIDRDLERLHARLAPDAIIIIDDIDGWPRVHSNAETAVIDQKHRLGRMLVDTFAREKLLKPASDHGGAGWFIRGRDAAPGEFERLALPAYRQLVKVALPLEDFDPRPRLRTRVARRLPWLARAWRHFVPAPSPPVRSGTPPVAIPEKGEIFEQFTIAP
jgi:predicted O-methyltransferase YrrM